MLDEKLIQKIIKDNYNVLLGFDVADGNMTLSEYIKKALQNKDSGMLK